MLLGTAGLPGPGLDVMPEAKHQKASDLAGQNANEAQSPQESPVVSLGWTVENFGEIWEKNRIEGLCFSDRSGCIGGDEPGWCHGLSQLSSQFKVSTPKPKGKNHGVWSSAVTGRNAWAGPLR